ncbi:hypothetical protein CALCODRAFT_498158 [Calocera cornea HHB12733]|uniref:tRNA-splicing endonuclease subunit Sen2 n=1 Tax=Calocera cornea HHB12733 TaxID=1353952 RepID=A0A165EYW4_9BASI|nr:hypothetical protein CALCODRAFT_498158 [Calocera cornea HHB12733]
MYRVSRHSDFGTPHGRPARPISRAYGAGARKGRTRLDQGQPTTTSLAMASSVAGPSTPTATAPTKSKRRQNPNNVIYANPLPLIIETRPPAPYTLGLLPFPRTKIINPECSGIYDALTRSVWIVGKRDVRVLWERGFFGKGSLSRSEPSWLTRKVQQLNGGEVLTAEEVTARRREQRKQFKVSRAAAIQKAAQEAEAAFSASLESPATTFELPLVNTPHNVPRPTFEPAASKGGTAGRPPPTEAKADKAANSEEEVEKQLREQPELLDEDQVENMEHLQLTLQEAFFLAWGLGCLRVLDRDSGQYLNLPALWSLCLTSSSSPVPTLSPTPAECRRPDNPFLIHYVAYHHFRSLGWVVRGGIKFCVDYLLYKRGPVFTHAEFAIVLCPEYDDPSDGSSSPFAFQKEPFTWTWFSTINRVNAQVKKTLVLAYVTIPAMSAVGERELGSPECLRMYSVREVVVRRFVPARMRD